MVCRGQELQPWIKVRRLPLTDQGGTVLREVNRLCDLGLLLPSLGELLRFSLGALRLTPQHQPGRPARRDGLARRLGHHP